MAKGKGKQWGRAYHVCKGKDCHNWCWADAVAKTPKCSGRWGREEGNSRHFLRLLHSKWAELGDATKEAFQDIQLLLDSLEEVPSATPYQEEVGPPGLGQPGQRGPQVDELQEVDKLMEEAKQAIDDAQSKLTEALEQSDPTQASPPPIGEVASSQDFGKALGIEFTKEQQAVLDKAVAAHLPPGLTARTGPVFHFQPRLSQPQGKPDQDQKTRAEDLDSTKEAPDASMKEPPEGELEENSNPRDRSPRRTSRNGSKEANKAQE
ncbi:unnamed protein product [Symbiodinium sp. CCMP2592]|nr:unnamed protein product [Symbiodinium sp. CCMP2592]